MTTIRGSCRSTGPHGPVGRVSVGAWLSGGYVILLGLSQRSEQGYSSLVLEDRDVTMTQWKAGEILVDHQMPSFRSHIDPEEWV